MLPKIVLTALLGFSILTNNDAVAAARRDAIDIAVQDANRKPGDLLRFSGVQRGDRVGDFMPGNGYFTRLLSTRVGTHGRVYYCR